MRSFSADDPSRSTSRRRNPLMLSTINWAADLAAVTGAFSELSCASDDASELRFADLAALAGGVAHRLRTAGLKPGEPVATCLRNGLPAVWASAGVRLAGAAETPLNPAFSEAERRHCLDLAAVRRIRTSRREMPFFAPPGVAPIAVEDIAPASLAGLPPVPAAACGRIS